MDIRATIRYRTSLESSMLHFGKKKIPIILQAEASECGLACLAMVLAGLDRPVALRTLRGNQGSSTRGMTLEGLSEIAKSFHLIPRPVRIELNEMRELRLPCILHWSFMHYVVLTRVGADYAVIHDPAVGKRIIKFEEMSTSFTGVAVEFTALEGFVQPNKAPIVSPLGVLWRSSGVSMAVLQVGAVSVAVELLTMATPLFQQWVVDTVLSTGDADLLTTLALAFGLVTLLKGCIGLLRDWTAIRFSHITNEQWLGGTFGHLLRLPARFFELRHLGDVLNRFDSARVVSNTSSSLIFSSVADAVLCLLTLMLLLVYSPWLTCVVLISLGFQIGVKLIANAATKEEAHRTTADEGRERGHLIETVRGIRAIKAYNREEDRQQYWLGLTSESARARLRQEKSRASIEAVSGTLMTLEYIVIFFIGAKFVMAQALTAGALFAFSMYRSQFNSRAMKLLDAGLKLKMLKIHSERMADIVGEDPEFQLTESREAPSGLPATIEFRNVSFRYSSTDRWILRNCSFVVEAGEHLAISGASGSGKSTLLKLVLGFLKPDEGEVLIGGVSTRSLGLRASRAMCASVLQEDTLFGGTVADNISFYAKGAQREHVESAARLAAIHAEIKKFPMGYGTFIGDMGSSLSGGERQRLLVARAFFHKAPILLMDEATSHLDHDNERRVVESIGRTRKTCLSIAHREQSLALAHRVLYLENGQLQPRKFSSDTLLTKITETL